MMIPAFDHAGHAHKVMPHAVASMFQVVYVLKLRAMAKLLTSRPTTSCSAVYFDLSLAGTDAK